MMEVKGEPDADRCGRAEQQQASPRRLDAKRGPRLGGRIVAPNPQRVAKGTEAKSGGAVMDVRQFAKPLSHPLIALRRGNYPRSEAEDRVIECHARSSCGSGMSF